MGDLFNYFQEKKEDFKGNPKDLEKLIKKVETCWNAPTTEKDVQRMLPFAESIEMTSFVNKNLKDYFIGCNEFRKYENGWKKYDIVESWYLFNC